MDMIGKVQAAISSFRETRRKEDEDQLHANAVVQVCIHFIIARNKKKLWTGKSTK
jgi:hypothetical protein